MMIGNILADRCAPSNQLSWDTNAPIMIYEMAWSVWFAQFW